MGHLQVRDDLAPSSGGVRSKTRALVETAAPELSNVTKNFPEPTPVSQWAPELPEVKIRHFTGFAQSFRSTRPPELFGGICLRGGLRPHRDVSGTRIDHHGLGCWPETSQATTQGSGEPGGGPGRSEISQNYFYNLRIIFPRSPENLRYGAPFPESWPLAETRFKIAN